MVNVGIVGLGAGWESRYHPALQKLQNRVRVRAVYDSVASRAESVANDYDATLAGGILPLLHRSDIEALVVLDMAWYGLQILRLACPAQKPIYVAGSLGSDLEQLTGLHQQAAAQGLTIMPELRLRHTPATGRLQELIATRIGRPQRVLVRAVVPVAAGNGLPPFPPADSLVGLIDWCRYIVRTAPRSVSAHADTAGTAQIDIDFAPGPEQPAPVTATLQLTLQAVATNGHGPQNGVPGVCEVACAEGRAVLEDTTTIVCETGPDTTREALSHERNEYEVMLDHFSRRVVGGLIPVADLADVCRSLALAHAARQSLATGQTVPVNV